MIDQSKIKPTCEENQGSENRASLSMLSRRDFGALSLLTTCTRSFFNQSLFELASPITQISEIVKGAHPLLTKEGIEIIFDLVAKRALYEKNFENLLDPSLGMHDQRMLTPSEEAQQYAYYSRRFENMKCKNEIFGRAFARCDQNGPFTGIVNDYERHCREQYLEVEVETESLIKKYILDPTARNSFIFRLRELREELMRSADLERQIDALQDKMVSLEINIESCIGQGWPIPISLFTSEIEDGCSADEVMRMLLDDDEIDADHAQNCREQIRYYEPIARDICQCKRFRPLWTYLNGGRGAEIFGSIRDLAETAGAGVIGEEVGEASFYLSHFHLSAYDWRSARLFPNRDKGSVEEFLEHIFGLFCTPDYQSHIRDGCGFNKHSYFYSTEESRMERMMNPEYGVTHYLLDVKRKRQSYQTMKAALGNVWPEVVHQLSSTGVFKTIENSLVECERVLSDFLKELTISSPKKQHEVSSNPSSDGLLPLDGIFLSADFRAYIEASINLRDSDPD